MNTKQTFKLQYRHLRKQISRGADKQSWFQVFTQRGGVSAAAVAAFKSR